jgi:fibronectin type 3 domain-containing protein
VDEFRIYNRALAASELLALVTNIPAPPAPTNFTATAGGSSVALSWSASANATSYNLKRSTTSGGETTLTNLTTTAYSDSAVVLYTNYYYVVSALNLGGEGPNSVEVSAVPGYVPAAPSGLSATVLSETQVRLAWTDNATNESAYGVERSLDSNSWFVLTGSLPANSTSYTDASCSSNTLYYFRVNCTNAVGASAYAVVSATTPAGIGDGIPGSWRLQFFGNGLTTNSTSCAACDPDGDGQNNLAEYLAGTDPNNNASVFALTGIATDADGFYTVNWNSMGGMSYVVQYSDTITSFTDIVTLTDPNPASTPGTLSFTDDFTLTPTPAGGRYYRVRLP